MKQQRSYKLYQARRLAKDRFDSLFHKNPEPDIINGIAKHVEEYNYSAHDVSIFFFLFLSHASSSTVCCSLFVINVQIFVSVVCCFCLSLRSL